MARYKPDDFDFSRMRERITFQTQLPDGSYEDTKTIWAHILRDGFTRQEPGNWYKILVREQKDLDTIAAMNNRIKWGKRLLSIKSWHDPVLEKHGFVQFLAVQIAADNDSGNTPDNELFKDFVTIYRMKKREITRFGIVSYEYYYDYENPVATGVRCSFSNDRGIYLDNKKFDVEHDSTIVSFNMKAPVEAEDIIVSPIHGRFKVDLVVKNDRNMLEAHVKRGDVQ